MFKSSENLRLAAEMRALERVARPWREARRTWFDGTPESIEARLASTERVLTYAKAGYTQAHLELTREASAARAELLDAKHRLLADFLDDGARAFKGSKRVAERDENNFREDVESLKRSLRPDFSEDPKNYLFGYDHLNNDGTPRTSAKDDKDPTRDGEHDEDFDDEELARYSSRRTADESTGFGTTLGPGYNRPGFGPEDLDEYDDYLHRHDYHTEPDDLHALEHKLRPGLDDDDPARYSSRRYADDNSSFMDFPNNAGGGGMIKNMPGAGGGGGMGNPFIDTFATTGQESTPAFNPGPEAPSLFGPAGQGANGGGKQTPSLFGDSASTANPINGPVPKDGVSDAINQGDLMPLNWGNPVSGGTDAGKFDGPNVPSYGDTSQPTPTSPNSGSGPKPTSGSGTSAPGGGSGSGKTSMRMAAIDFVANQNTTDRGELLFRAHRHASERTGTLPVPVAQRMVQAFVAEVNREAAALPQPRRTAQRTAAVVADFPDELMF